MAVLPPDTRITGDPGPASDHNALTDCLTAITGAVPGGTVTTQQTLDTIAGAVTASQVLAGNGTHVTLRALAAADLPAATTSAQGAVILDGTAADLATDGNQAAGAVGKAADAAHVHPQVNGTWLPSSGGSGWLGWNSDPCTAGVANNTVAGAVYLQRLNFYAPTTVTNLIYIMTVLGAGTSTGTFVGLYSSAGTRLTASADLATSFNASGTVGAVPCPVTTPQAFTAGTFAWAAIVTNLATTQPTLARQVNVATLANPGLTAANFRWAVNGLTQTSLPVSITPASNNTGTSFNANTFIVAWS